MDFHDEVKSFRSRNEENSFIEPQLLVIFVIACQPTEPWVNNSALKPGDEINGMIIDNGIPDAIPLWAFCLNNPKKNNARSVHCQIPQVHKLGIGQPFGMADTVFQNSDWSKLTWEFSVDGRVVDLKAFGTYTFVNPDLAPGPSGVRELFRQVKVWDVILVDPTSGVHTLSGKAFDEVSTYRWYVNFTVTSPTMQKE